MHCMRILKKKTINQVELRASTKKIRLQDSQELLKDSLKQLNKNRLVIKENWNLDIHRQKFLLYLRKRRKINQKTYFKKTYQKTERPEESCFVSPD